MCRVVTDVVSVVVSRVGIWVVTTGGIELAVIVDTSQDRSSTNCDTPLVGRFDNKSFALVCIEQTSDQTSMATQSDIDKHKSMQSPTEDVA